MVEPTENPASTSNHLPNCSFPWSHLRRSLASFWFVEYFITAWLKATWYGATPAGPDGCAPCWMSRHSGSPFSSLIFSDPRFAAMKIDAPLSVPLISPDRNARLLLVSSHARPPSSHASFQ